MTTLTPAPAAARAHGRQLGVVAGLVDDYTRECLAIEINTSLGGIRVVRVLRSENGPGFLSRAVDQWAYENQVAC